MTQFTDNYDEIRIFTFTGQVPTVPPSEYKSDGSWNITDLFNGQFAINVVDKKAWYRSNDEIVEILSDKTTTITLDTLILNPNYVSTGNETLGTLFYDAANETVSIVLPNGVTLQLGQELFIDIENKTGAELTNGKAISYEGTVGNSGLMLGEYALATAAYHPLMTLGILTQTLNDEESGKVTTLGKVRGIPASGVEYGETWLNGEIVYLSSINTGGLTNVMPQAPIPAIPMAVVISNHATNGTLFVRPTFPQRLVDLIDVNGTPTDTDGQIPVWDNVNKYFDFTANINDYIKKPLNPINNDVLQYNSTTGLWERRQDLLFNLGKGIYFGDDTSIREIAEDVLLFTVKGDLDWILDANAFHGFSTSRPGLRNAQSTRTVPSLITQYGKSVLTGHGGFEHEVSTINQGVEGFRVTGAEVRALHELFAPSAKIGDVANYTGFETDGSMIFKGTATVFDDAQMPLISTTKQTPSGDILINEAEQTLDFSDACTLADYAIASIQMSHKWLKGSDISPHIHWTQTAIGNPNWMVQYRWQVNNQPKTTAWTDLKMNVPVFTYVSGVLNQISNGADITPPATAVISDIIQFRIIRDTNNDSGLFAGTDPVSGDISSLSFDYHFEIDQVGSKEEYVK